MRTLPAVLVLFSVALSACLAQAPAYASDPAFVKQREEARRLEKSPQGLMFAAAAWKKANKIDGGRCLECLEAIAAVHLKRNETKDAQQAAREMETLAATPVDHVRAELLLGRAVVNGTDRRKPNMALLEEAHTALEKAATLSNAANFYNGRVLAFMGRRAEASESFEAYSKKTSATDPLRVRSTHFAAHPELSTEDGSRGSGDHRSG